MKEQTIFSERYFNIQTLNSSATLIMSLDVFIMIMWPFVKDLDVLLRAVSASEATTKRI